MATLCSQSTKVQLERLDDTSEVRVILRPTRMQKILSWVTVLTAEVVVRMAGDDRLEDELARFKQPVNRQ